ncbi:MAG: hypothetical protein J6Y64_05320 [Ruminococcus sp.]|nr:hypothetical protein [Ruminococcus sp.]
MADISEYKCPSCGAPMRFEISGQSMVCSSCSKTYDIEYIRSHFDEVNDEKLSDFDWSDTDEKDLDRLNRCGKAKSFRTIGVYPVKITWKKGETINETALW